MINGIAQIAKLESILRFYLLQGGVMGFWGKLGNASYKTAKFIGSAATVVANSVEQKTGELKDLKEEYEQKSDEELVKIIKNNGFTGSSESEKGVARRVLRERGYMSGPA